MLDLKQIESFYPSYLKTFKRSLLREYLQYKILDIIFSSQFSQKLSFMGGTAIHIVHGNPRFSEDLDFDNLGLDQNDFKHLIDLIQKKLNLEGYHSEIQTSHKGAYRGFISILDILYEQGLSPHKNEKLMIQVDTEPQKFQYKKEKVIIRKFEIFTKILIVPIDILLAQKICAVFTRKRSLGRDFYDILFLFGRTKPNFSYLTSKLNIHNIKELKNNIVQKCQGFDFKSLSQDVSPFLFFPDEAKKILLFLDYIKSLPES